ncbi:MAG: hypothetical protein AB7G11_02465 [Phycisphaerales bacterium]
MLDTMRKYLASKCTGRQCIMGTDWPVETYVHRVGKRAYRVTFGVCNGTASHAIDFRTRREAFEAAGIDD